MNADDRIAQLTKQVRALEQDAARYQHLRGLFSPMGLDANDNHAWLFRGSVSLLRGPNMDEAVDRAIVKQVADTAILAEYFNKKEEGK